MLKIDSISNNIINNISLVVEDNNITTIIGKSGVGKTTLARCIIGLHEITTGSIILDNIVLAKDKQIIPINKRKIGMMFQEYLMLPFYNVYDNITIGHNDEKLVKELAKILNIDDILYKPINGLSGGEQQRIAFLRAIIYNSKLLILDEPFSNINKDLQDKMIYIINNYVKDIPIIIITHTLNENLKNTHIVHMKDKYLELIQ